jgi:hypothetical protein
VQHHVLQEPKARQEIHLFLHVPHASAVWLHAHNLHAATAVPKETAIVSSLLQSGVVLQDARGEVEHFQLPGQKILQLLLTQRLRLRKKSTSKK